MIARNVREEVETLARRDRSPRCAADAGQPVGIVERNGLLQPGRGERLELDRHLDGCGRREATVHLDHVLDVVPTASRTAATSSIERRRSAGRSHIQAFPNGSSLSAV